MILCILLLFLRSKDYLIICSAIWCFASWSRGSIIVVTFPRWVSRATSRVSPFSRCIHVGFISVGAITWFLEFASPLWLSRTRWSRRGSSGAAAMLWITTRFLFSSKSLSESRLTLFLRNARYSCWISQDLNSGSPLKQREYFWGCSCHIGCGVWAIPIPSFGLCTIYLKFSIAQ